MPRRDPPSSVATRSLQKAVVAAKEAKDEPKERALEAALATMAVHAGEAGLRMPQPRERKGGGRRRKTTAA